MAEQEPTPQCIHHWLIESPKGPTSWGMCKHCGRRREFSNSASDVLWDGEGIGAVASDVRKGGYGRDNWIPRDAEVQQVA